MMLRIEIDREVDGRWIAEATHPELGLLCHLYGATLLDALCNVLETSWLILDEGGDRIH